ncbi:N-6 DNA methylase [Paenibacillus sp. FSL R5-0701]|uniref:N-6 DNA methylase n=1 Tax=Paenibacillus sp. FSL R5-0701 TaxID=2921654 RepID=UPI0030CAB453
MIQGFWELCWNHDLKTRDHLLREAVRVAKMKQHMDQIPAEHDDITSDPELLFERMKEQLGTMELGHFPGDRELFYKLYHMGKDIDLLEYGLQTIRQDRVIASLQVHFGVFQTFIEHASRQRNGRNWLVTETEKFMEGLSKERVLPEGVRLTLLTDNYIVTVLLKTYYRDQPAVRVIQGSIYQPLQLNEVFDAILSVPNFGLKLEDHDIRMREAEGAAIQHLTPLLASGGKLVAVLPARMMFQSGSIGEWRLEMNERYPVSAIYVLPEGLFRPYTSVKTYLILFCNEQSVADVRIGRYKLASSILEEDDVIGYKKAAFQQLEDWRIELLLDQDSQTLASFQQAAVPKIKLKAAADLFRGKSILKQDLQPGTVSVLNISNLEDGEVKLDQLETIHEEERKVKRYEVLEGDLVMTCRGTQTKLAVFPGHSQMVIASANMIVIRFREQVNSMYAKMFLESPVGLAFIQSFQRGTTVMNLNPADVGEIEIPLWPMERQLTMSQQYVEEKKLYMETLQAATQRWEQQKEQMYMALF